METYMPQLVNRQKRLPRTILQYLKQAPCEENRKSNHLVEMCNLFYACDDIEFYVFGVIFN